MGVELLSSITTLNKIEHKKGYGDFKNLGGSCREREAKRLRLCEREREREPKRLYFERERDVRRVGKWGLNGGEIGALVGLKGKKNIGFVTVIKNYRVVGVEHKGNDTV
ncbi:hypothetical protein ACB098_06G016200 [Castanea mollissima]